MSRKSLKRSSFKAMQKKELAEIKSFYMLTKSIIESKTLKTARKSSDLAVMFWIASSSIVKEFKLRPYIVDDYYSKLLDVSIKNYPSKGIKVKKSSSEELVKDLVSSIHTKGNGDVVDKKEIRIHFHEFDRLVELAKIKGLIFEPRKNKLQTIEDGRID